MPFCRTRRTGELSLSCNGTKLTVDSELHLFPSDPSLLKSHLKSDLTLQLLAPLDCHIENLSLLHQLQDRPPRLVIKAPRARTWLECWLSGLDLAV